MTLTSRIHPIAVAVSLLALSPLQSLQAQTLNPAGHYEGSVSSPAGQLTFQIDLTKSVTGAIVGTLTVPAQKLKGFPLSNVVVKANDVSFDIASTGGGSFRGELTANGISGEFSTQMGALPLELQRAGEARTYSLPPGTPIAKGLEGVWSGALDVAGGMRVTLNLASQPDGTGGGTLVSVDENNLTVPLAIAQDGTRVTLTLPMIGSSYVGTLNAAGTEVSGTYTTSQGLALPLSFKRLEQIR